MANISDFVRNMMAYNVIDPTITFDGDYTYQSLRSYVYNSKADMLLLNSKKDKDGNNMYEQFLRRNFYDPVNLSSIIPMPDGFIFPLLVNQMSEDGKHRVLRYNYIYTIFNLLENKQLITSTDVCELAEITRNWYKEQRKTLKEYKAKRLDSEHYKEVLLRFSCTHEFNAQRGDITAFQYAEHPELMDKMITDEWLDKYIEKFTNIIVVLRHIISHTQEKHNVSNKDFEACFEPETLLLMTMKAIIDNQESSIRINGKPDSAFIEVAQYITALKTLGIKNYDYSIKCFDHASKQIKKYSVKDLMNDYKKIISKYGSTMNNYQLTAEQVERMGLSHSIEAIDKFRQLVNQDDENIIKTNWDILSPGESYGYSAPKSRRNPDGEGTGNRIDEDEILYRRYIFQQTDFLKQIVGKDKFEGYVGYIYENGLVIFEKFYEDGGKVAQMQATYVMNYKNFIKFTQYTKSEIVEYIKNTSNPEVMRLYHTKNWADRLASVIGSVDKTMESQVFAETISADDIKNKK